MKALKSLTWAINKNDDKIAFQLIGELSRDTLLPLWEQRASFLSAEKLSMSYIYWDLSQVNRIDSAGFALLCDFLQYCQTTVKREQRIILKNVPSQFFTLADLFGLSAWIATFVQSDGK
ncbi:lipid asymmetry maintenance protein MlaB [Pasteurella canis]|uniref:Sulfate transporter/antisigma-factor antagonist STAS family protein n=1 Tax=Pasteurella canis TaxID=753 RepID=A0A379EUY4_9PAST|nr:lipid asymmetry maintenance protein MlaB [Pasteurella canis]MXN89092.1 STAS domain-containing protein [Pasteurella canis]UAY76839.1 lipid asymmetry maintenance protein MlaB [Pasteurella canis]UDW82866.1 lipid asymmetry maintenance protein MlaB [Pasteurella canis]SUC10205.1 sulfate transporter/antisigma-factor antagonist STAS family protein [Pasteurella canis]